MKCIWRFKKEYQSLPTTVYPKEEGQEWDQYNQWRMEDRQWVNWVYPPDGLKGGGGGRIYCYLIVNV